MSIRSLFNFYTSTLISRWSDLTTFEARKRKHFDRDELSAHQGRAYAGERGVSISSSLRRAENISISFVTVSERLFFVLFFFSSLASSLFRLVIPSPLSVASLSRSTSSHYTSAILQSFDDHRSSHSISHDSSMTDVDHRKAALYLTSSSSNSVPALPFEDEEENNFSFTRPLFTSPEEKRKEKGNTSNLSSVSTTPSQKNPALQRDCYSRGRPRNHQQQESKLSVTHNTSIISSRRTWKWKQNAGDLPRNVFVSDNNSSSGSEDAEDDVICSSSFSSAAAATTARTAAATSKATVAADCSSRRQRRKQTRLKKKTPHRERKEKEKKTMKKERNKKSPSPSSSIEAAQASLFQCCALNTTGVGTQPGCDPNEQARCADTNVASQQNCFSMQTSLEHRQQVCNMSCPLSLLCF